MPRLDRQISSLLGIKRASVRLMLAQGRVCVDGAVCWEIAQQINDFSHITCDNKVIQQRIPHYVMLNKPEGVVSATADDHHRTVIDLLDQPYRRELHIVGRLDFNSTGLVLLTNDGQWSRQLSLPESKLPKRYRVRVEQPLSENYVQAFEQGMYFSYEDITTLPATLRILGEFEAEVALVEGRYHQIKRMFGRFNNRVMSIHRFAVGGLELDPQLEPGQGRELAPPELEILRATTASRVSAN